MKNIRTVAVVATLLAVAGKGAMAQEKPSTGTNSLSVRGINENDIMMKKTLWRRVDLKEKQNQSMFSKNNEITKYLIEAMKAGLIDGYENDSVTTKLTPDKIQKRLIMPNSAPQLSAEEIAAGFGTETTGGGNDGWGDTKKDPKNQQLNQPMMAGVRQRKQLQPLNLLMTAGDHRQRKRLLLKLQKVKKAPKLLS